MRRVLAVIGLSLALFGVLNTSVIAQQNLNQSNLNVTTPYTQEVFQKLLSRCDLIQNYLSNSARISELAARQNKVRGWEYVLRQAEDLSDQYKKFNKDKSNFDQSLSSLRSQLTQFKKDFEAYDEEFSKLNGLSCSSNPSQFWEQLNKVRTFRSGVHLATVTYEANLELFFKTEEAIW